MLDLLAVLMVLQFGSLYSTRILWALGLIPVWGAYSLYKLVRGGGGDGGGAAPSSTGGDTREESEDTKAKRQKRAEKRRQKWS